MEMAYISIIVYFLPNPIKYWYKKNKNKKKVLFFSLWVIELMYVEICPHGECNVSLIHITFDSFLG